MRVMAVDYGDAHTGIAVSDPTGFITGYTGVIDMHDPLRCADLVAEAAKNHGAERVVVGRPLNMNGTTGDRVAKAEAFAEMLRERLDLEVVLWDERLTSVDANRILSDAGKKRKKQKRLVDAVAASLILESYLDYIRK